MTTCSSQCACRRPADPASPPLPAAEIDSLLERHVADGMSSIRGTQPPSSRGGSAISISSTFSSGTKKTSPAHPR